MKLQLLRLVMLLAALIAGPALAAGTPVKITADSFTIDEASKQAVFTGSVVITRGALTMWSAKVVVHYGAGGQSDIDSLEATGGVKVKTTDQEATGDKATFTAANSIVRLTGNVSVVNAQGTMNGPELTIDLANNKSTFTGNGKKGGRVTGVFTPQ